MLLPLTFAVGFGLDYGRALRAQTKLNAIADSAALMAVSPAMMAQSDSAAASAATAYFNAQVATLAGITVSNLSIAAPTTSSGALAGTRVATVTYQATSANLFSGILGRMTLPVSGTAQANAAQPPSINFYVMLDTSPSMLLPTTSSGISTLSTATRNQWGSYTCAFACHDQHPETTFGKIRDTSSRYILLNVNYGTSGASGYNTFYRYNSSSRTVFDANGTQIGTGASLTCSVGGSTGSCGYAWKLAWTQSGTAQSASVYYADNWWLARNYGTIYGSPASIDLRVDAETDAAQNLVTFAQSMVNTYNTADHPVTYQMKFLTFNYGAPTALSATSSLVNVNSLSTSSIPDIGMQAPWLWDTEYWTTSSVATYDQDTDFKTMLNTMNAAIPNPGTGATPASPQAVMFIVTDGLADEGITGYSCGGVSGRACTQLTANHLSQCSAIKNRGVRIAILYTEYLPSSINTISFGQTIATNNVPYIEQQLKACSSTNSDGTQLYYKVTTDQDISAALNRLFSMAVQTAHLVR
jgi:Flp pilus assembly protein TadG